MTSRNEKKFEFKLGKQGLLLFVVGMSLLLFVAFVSGVMVGIHIDAYPERIAQSIPDIIKSQLHHQKPYTAATIPVGRDESKPPAVSEENNAAETLPSDLAAKQLLPLPENSRTETTFPASLPVYQADIARKTQPPVAQKATPTLQPAATLPALPSLKAQASMAPATGLKTVKSAPPAPPAEAAVKPALKAAGEYLVQVGSFQSRHKAKQFGNKFTALGYQPQVAMVDLPNKGKWFRVVIGGFATKGEALKAADLLAEKIKGVTYVVHPASK